MKISAVFNRDGGTFRTMDMEAFSAQAQAVFARHGHQLDVQIVCGGDVKEALEKASEGSDMGSDMAGAPDIMMAGGGDGTISTAAAIAWRRRVPLAVLPAGTMNLFARSLQIPLDLAAALEALAQGTVRHVDIATCDGRPFVHQFAIGLHPRMVLLRETFSYRSRLGKIAANMRALGLLIIDPPKFPVEIEIDGVRVNKTVSGVFVSNNSYGEDARLPYAAALDGGHLGVYIANPLPLGGFLSLIWDIARGRWHNNQNVEVIKASDVLIRFPKLKRRAKAVIDGELVALKQGTRIEVHPGALAVLAPQEAE